MLAALERSLESGTNILYQVVLVNVMIFFWHGIDIYSYNQINYNITYTERFILPLTIKFKHVFYIMD